jgi:hypothetical protein
VVHDAVHPRPPLDLQQPIGTLNRRPLEAPSGCAARERSRAGRVAGGPTSRRQLGMVDSGDTASNGPRRLAAPSSDARRPACRAAVMRVALGAA